VPLRGFLGGTTASAENGESKGTVWCVESVVQGGTFFQARGPGPETIVTAIRFRAGGSNEK